MARMRDFKKESSWVVEYFNDDHPNNYLIKSPHKVNKHHCHRPLHLKFYEELESSKVKAFYNIKSSDATSGS